MSVNLFFSSKDTVALLRFSVVPLISRTSRNSGGSTSSAATLASPLKDPGICVSSATASFPTCVESSLPLCTLWSAGSHAGHSKHYVKSCWVLWRQSTLSFSRSSTQRGSDLGFSPSFLWAVVSGSFQLLIPGCSDRSQMLSTQSSLRLRRWSAP